MSQLARLIAILTQLRSRRILTGPELARKYDVSLRTIYRDIRKLNEAGVPVVTLEGRGYALMEGYSVPPGTFSESEANAIITAGKLVAGSSDQSLIDEFESALTKIKSVFRGSIQEKGEILDDRIRIQNQAGPVRSHSLSEIQQAITNFRQIEIEYMRPGHDATLRRIEPAALYSSEYNWILIAWCHLRDDYRAFRLDRIRRYQLLDERFEDRGFELQKYFQECPPLEHAARNVPPSSTKVGPTP